MRVSDTIEADYDGLGQAFSFDVTFNERECAWEAVLSGQAEPFRRQLRPDANHRLIEIPPTGYRTRYPVALDRSASTVFAIIQGGERYYRFESDGGPPAEVYRVTETGEYRSTHPFPRVQIWGDPVPVTLRAGFFNYWSIFDFARGRLDEFVLPYVNAVITDCGG
jgi:hypothetical protein